MKRQRILTSVLVLGLLLALAAGLSLAQGPGPPGEVGEGEVTVGGGMAPQAILDDGFWYQGRLTDGAGNPLANTNVSVTFRIYDVSSGGTALDSTTFTVNTDENGLFNEEIDFNNHDLFNGQPLYLSAQVSGEASEMTPRQDLRPVPSAMSIRPGAIIRSDSVSSSYDPVLEIRSNYSSTSDLDGLKVYSNSGGEAIEGYSKYGKGVYGNTTADGTTANAGVYGDSSNNAPGVRGRNTGGTDGANSYGGYFTSAYRRGLYAEGGGIYYAAYFQGGSTGNGIYVIGDVDATGLKNAAVQAGDYGVRKLSAIESPNVWFEDFGQAQLVSGQATVIIEPLFLSTINTEVTYHVFVTPLGDCNGLYVTNKTATSFEVRELGGGAADVAFDYRIVALRKGYETVRMEPLTEGGKPLEVGSPTPSVEPEPEEP
jgi:hypothetical protein